MSLAASRFLFVLVLVLNVVLWSNSRYGQSPTTKSVQLQQGSLVRRISYELMHPGEIRTSDDEVSRSQLTLGQLTRLILVLSNFCTGSRAMFTCRGTMSLPLYFPIPRLSSFLLLCKACAATPLIHCSRYVAHIPVLNSEHQCLRFLFP
jgi:hypothetical protein